MLRTANRRHSVGAAGLLLTCCMLLGGAYLWAVWMGAVQFGSVISPLSAYVGFAMR